MRRKGFPTLLAAIPVLLLALAPRALAQADVNRLEIEDIFELEAVSDPQISPDGSQIIYVRQFAEIMEDTRAALFLRSPFQSH